MPEEVKIVTQRQEEIVNTGPRHPRVEPALVAAALGGEIVRKEALPKRIREAVFCTLLHRSTL